MLPCPEQIEGRGNGIKTNVVNCTEIAKALERPTDCERPWVAALPESWRRTGRLGAASPASSVLCPRGCWPCRWAAVCQRLLAAHLTAPTSTTLASPGDCGLGGLTDGLTCSASFAHPPPPWARPLADILKFFGTELGAQTKYDKSSGNSIVNGAHDAGKLSELLEGFIKKYVQVRTESQGPLLCVLGPGVQKPLWQLGGPLLGLKLCGAWSLGFGCAWLALGTTPGHHTWPRCCMHWWPCLLRGRPPTTHPCRPHLPLLPSFVPSFFLPRSATPAATPRRW